MYLEEQLWRRFLGTGAANADGDSLEAFLKKYDPNKYQNPSNTVDTAVFTYRRDGSRRQVSSVLLIRRKNHPSIGWWALPGGFVEYREDMDKAALRELQEETGIQDIEMCQLRSYGAYDRDPRTRIITTAYVALVPEGSVVARAGDDAGDAGWFSVMDTVSGESLQGNCRTVIHKLTLQERSRGVVTTSTVEERIRHNSLLPDVRFTVLDTDLLAADHAAIILEAYAFVRKQLELKA